MNDPTLMLLKIRPVSTANIAKSQIYNLEKMILKAHNRLGSV